MSALASISKFRSALGSLIAGKGWKQAWAAGLDEGMARGAKLTQPYAQSPWVFRAIQHIAGPCSSVPLKWQNQGTNEDAPADADRNAFWSRPARGIDGPMSYNEFIEAIVAWMNLEGNAFIILDDTWIGASRERSPLLLARPDRMRAVTARGELLGWEFMDAGGMRHALIPEQVMRPRFFNPYDDLCGLAPWRAAQIAADADYAAGVFSKNLMQSNGDRGVYVIAKDGVTDDAQRQQIEAMLRQKRELNRRGEYRAAFLTGDIKIEDPKVQSTDANFVAQRLQNRHEVFIAFGVPASMADVMASYSIGAASDRFRLIEETCIPIGARISQHLERIEQRRTGKAVECCMDWAQHSVMRQVRNGQTDSLKTLCSVGVPFDVANAWLGLGIPPFRGDRVGYLPLSVQPANGEPPAEDTQEPDAAPADADQPDAGEDLAKSLDALASLMKSAPSTCRECGGAHEPGAEHRAAPDDARAQQWRALMAAREPSVKMIRAQVGKALAEARAETLKNLEATKSLATVKQRGVLEIIFDLGKFTARMWSLLQGPLTQSVKDSVQQFGEELALDDPWTMEDPEVGRYVGSRQSRMKDASEEIWFDVKTSIQEGLDANESNAKLAARIREKFTGISKHRSEVIAQTETGAAYGHARQRAMEASNIEWKEWLTARDDKVRAEHVRADGQQVRTEEAFDVAGESLMGPGDPAGSAANVINCRCVAIPILKPREEQS